MDKHPLKIFQKYIHYTKQGGKIAHAYIIILEKYIYEMMIRYTAMHFFMNLLDMVKASHSKSLLSP